jgi:hypothetical protein
MIQMENIWPLREYGRDILWYFSIKRGNFSEMIMKTRDRFRIKTKCKLGWQNNNCNNGHWDCDNKDVYNCADHSWDQSLKIPS